jgi:hypothetical protein
MTPVSISKTVTRTWNGRPGKQFTLHFDRRPMGKRVEVTQWLDFTFELTIRAIDGDGRTPNFREFTKLSTRAVGDWQNEAARIARSLADEYFA